MAATIIRDNIIDPALVRLSEVKQLDNGGKSVFVSYNDEKLVIETPMMVSPFGVSNYVGDKGEASDKWTLQLSFGNDPSPALATLKESLMAFDEHVLKHACNNSLQWLKHRSLSMEAASMLYTPTVRFARDRDTGEITDKYPPTFRLTVPTTNGQFTVPTYNVNREKVDLSTIDTRRAKINAIVQCSSIWIAGGRFGASWRVVQLRVVPAQSFNGYAFSAIEDDPIITAMPSSALSTNVNPAYIKAQDEDEEDDDDLDF